MGTPQRFALIDGLRGLAASGVMLHHFSGHRAFAPVAGMLPSAINDSLRYGGVGVAVFFVISGFVIAASFGDGPPTAGHSARFLWRRAVRLCPPYYATIVLVLALGWLKGRLFPAHAAEFPSAGSLAAHATYTFGIFGYEPILAVFWTLAHEVQFYAAYCLLLGLFGRGGRPAWVFAVTGAASATGLIDVRGWAFVTWWMFAAGVLLYDSLVSKAARPWAAAFFVTALGIQALRPTPYGLGALATSGLIAVAACRGGLGRWLAARPLQYLGATSYSLYLLHGVLGWQVLSVAGDVLGVRSPIGSAGALLAAVGVSLGSADLMRRFVERPSLALAKRFKRREAGPEGRPDGSPDGQERRQGVQAACPVA